MISHCFHSRQHVVDLLLLGKVREADAGVAGPKDLRFCVRLSICPGRRPGDGWACTGTEKPARWRRNVILGNFAPFLLQQGADPESPSKRTVAGEVWEHGRRSNDSVLQVHARRTCRNTEHGIEPASLLSIRSRTRLVPGGFAVMHHVVRCVQYRRTSQNISIPQSPMGGPTWEALPSGL